MALLDVATNRNNVGDVSTDTHRSIDWLSRVNAAQEPCAAPTAHGICNRLSSTANAIHNQIINGRNFLEK